MGGILYISYLVITSCNTCVAHDICCLRSMVCSIAQRTCSIHAYISYLVITSCKQAFCNSLPLGICKTPAVLKQYWLLSFYLYTMSNTFMFSLYLILLMTMGPSWIPKSKSKSIEHVYNQLKEDETFARMITTLLIIDSSFKHKSFLHVLGYVMHECTLLLPSRI